MTTSIDGTRAASARGSREMPVWGKVSEKRSAMVGAGWAQTDIWTLTEYLKPIQSAK